MNDGKTSNAPPTSASEPQAETALTPMPTEVLGGGNIARYDQQRAGMVVLGSMEEPEWKNTLARIKRGVERVREVKQAVMRDGIDYGIIKGTKSATLLKPGAESLLALARLVPSFMVQRIVGDGKTSPHLTYIVTSRVHLGNTEGPVVCEGVGSCNSWERKYRYRKGALACPECGEVLKRSKWHLKGEPSGSPKAWWCPGDSGGCGNRFSGSDERITSQTVGRVDNGDPYDLDNTLLKQAKKRALVDVALTATASSGEFTQDMEEHIERKKEQTTETAKGNPAKEAALRIRKLMDDVDIGDADARKAFCEKVLAKTITSLGSLTIPELGAIENALQSKWTELRSSKPEPENAVEADDFTDATEDDIPVDDGI